MISYLDTVIKTGSESIETTLRREANLVCGVCGAHGGCETPEVRDVRRVGGGRGLRGGPGQRVDGVFPGRLQPRTRGNDAGRRRKGQNVSWRNGSLQRKPWLDYGMKY